MRRFVTSRPVVTSTAHLGNYCTGQSRVVHDHALPDHFMVSCECLGHFERRGAEPNDFDTRMRRDRLAPRTTTENRRQLFKTLLMRTLREVCCHTAALSSTSMLLRDGVHTTYGTRFPSFAQP